jgi:hypothetical protein
MLGLTTTLKLGNTATTALGAFLDNSNQACYQWAKDNWHKVRAMSSRRLSLPNIVPPQNDPTAWQLCLQHVLKEQTGLNWFTPKNGTQFKVSQGSLWSKMGIWVHYYAPWYGSSEAAQFGIIKESLQHCGECDEMAGKVLCLKQDNHWRCVDKHRQILEPLDVSSVRGVEELEEEEEEEEEGQKEEEHKQQGTVIDRLLGHLGFTDGSTVEGGGVCHQDLKLAWSKAVVDDNDTKDLLDVYRVDIKPALAHRSNEKKILGHVTSILQSVGLQLKAKRQRTDDGKRFRKYHVTLSNNYIFHLHSEQHST